MRSAVIILGILGAHEKVERAASPARAGASPHARDLSLVREALAGSPAARRQFAEIMHCVPKFLSVINARTGRPLSDDELEDVSQETLMEIWRRLGDYAGLAALQTWAYRFCQNVLSSRLRTLRRRPKNVAIAEGPEREFKPTSSLDYEHVYAALERVDEDDACIVRLKHFEHLTFEQIGARLGLSASRAKAGYQRALARMRDILGPLHKEAGS